MLEKIILVDENDTEIGIGEKLEVHQKEQLHRAFSIFIFDWDTGRMLIQQRALGKYHSGGLWTNACCSHPRAGCTMEESLTSRLNVELGIDAGEENIRILRPDDEPRIPPKEHTVYACGKFMYYAPYDGLSEHEVDHVFLYSVGIGTGAEILKKEMKYNPEEIMAIRWIEIGELDLWLHESPEEFTAWFAKAYRLVRPVLERQAKEIKRDI